jgi:hypothetical protein
LKICGKNSEIKLKKDRKTIEKRKKEEKENGE